MATAAAFFDVDRTLIAGSSTYQFGRASYKAGFITRRQLAQQAFSNLRFRLHGSTDEMLEAAKDTVGTMLSGVRVRDLERLMPDILAGLLPRVYEEVLQIAYAHQDAGRPIYICTAAAQEMADLIATVFRFDGGIGSELEVVNARYTGTVSRLLYREGKAEAIRELAEREGIDLQQSWAYTDSESDLPMLRVVGNRVVVNPDRDLEAIAKAEEWEVLHFDRLARRIRLGTAAVVAAGMGGFGSIALRKRAVDLANREVNEQRRGLFRGKRSNNAD